MTETGASIFYSPMEECADNDPRIHEEVALHEVYTKRSASQKAYRKCVTCVRKSFGYAIASAGHATFMSNFMNVERERPLIAKRIVLASLDTRKAETIRDRDWFCQCNSQLFLANGFLLVFSEPERCI